MPAEIDGGPVDHDVVLYDADEDLVEALRGYVAEGLARREAVIVVVTPDHAKALEAALVASGVGPGEARSAGLLVSQDAGELLGRFMCGGHPGAREFEAVVGGLVKAAGAARPVRVYGEMVAVLWDAGNVLAAIELEDLWNKLARSVPFSLLCGYRSGAVAGDDRVGPLAEVCHVHSAVTALPPQAGAAARRSPTVVTRAFPDEPGSLRVARRFIADALAGTAHEHRAEDVSLVVTELAANAITHAGSSFVVGASVLDGHLRVWVRDGSASPPARRPSSVTSERGRGLALVDAVADRWGHDAVDGGKVVWAAFVEPASVTADR
jgi:anti-sigma regulatory factor (Ser/Thr protein kinase)